MVIIGRTIVLGSLIHGDLGFLEWTIISTSMSNSNFCRTYGSYTYSCFSGWWFGTCGLCFHLLGMSSSQLTFIFFRGVETTNQLCIYIYAKLCSVV